MQTFPTTFISFFFFFLFFYLFIFGSVGSSLLCVGFFQLRRAGAALHPGARASHCGGFSYCRAWGSRLAGFSSRGSRALERRLSSCAWAQLLRGMWDLPGPGLKPVFPALADGFSTTAPPGKPPHLFLYFKLVEVEIWPNSDYVIRNFIFKNETNHITYQMGKLLFASSF